MKLFQMVQWFYGNVEIASTKKVSICKLYIFLYSVISNLIFLQKKKKIIT